MKSENIKIVELIKNGLSYKEVSDKVGKSSNSVRCICNRENIKSSDYKNYKKDEIIKCLECDSEIKNEWVNRKFCSSSCSTTYNNKHRKISKKIKKCINCGEILKRSSKKYCSKKCQTDFKYKEYIKKWKNNEIDGNIGKNKDALSLNIRKYIFEKYNSKCTKCGWNEINKFTGKIPLEIDHIDGNHLNSVENNLILLCPSCHSLTEFYGSRNKGRGRKNRRK